MRLPMRLIFAALIALLASPAIAQDNLLIPAKRLVIMENTDMPGGDLAQVFDVTMQQCEAACLANPDCQALTFNARSNACFPKSDPGEAAPFQGAYSAVVMTAEPAVIAQAAARAAALREIATPSDLAAALAQAQGLGRNHLAGSGDLSAQDMIDMAATARDSGDPDTALRLTGAALSITDSADQWLEYARLALMVTSQGRSTMLDQSALAALNGYLRAQGDPTAAEALAQFATAREEQGQTRRALQALRLAADLHGRDDLIALRDQAEAKYGFRIIDQIVDADGTDPKICAVFSENLAESGVDYAPFVALPRSGLSVQAANDRLCVGGLNHGERVTVTFRQGLPSGEGQVLRADVEANQYIRDRAPQVRFEGRAYVLPRSADAGLPVVSVNTDRLNLELIRVGDRNLIRSLREGFLGRPMDGWSAEYVGDQMGQVVWTGTAEVPMQVNTDVTTRLPVQEVTGPLGPGIYALQASVPMKDADQVLPATQWFVVSDIGITSLGGADGLTVVARALSDAAALPGAEVTLLSRANDVLGQVRADDQGVARFDAALTTGTGGAAPAAVQVTTGDDQDFAFLPLTDPEFDLSDRGVEGLPPAPPVDVFLTTDRGAYRAGELINATILARTPEARAITGLPLTAVLTRPDGVEFARQPAPEAGSGGHVTAFAIPATAPRGTWRLDVLADPKAPALASTRVLVEDFLPERLDFTPVLPEGPLAHGTTPVMSLDARYLFGAPAANLPVEGEVRLSPASALPGFDGYSFGLLDARFDPVTEVLPAAVTDDQGRLSLPLTLPETGPDGDRPLTARLTVAVREGSGRPVERQVERLLMPERTVIGIKPLFEGGAVAEGQPAGFQIIAVGPDGQPRDTTATWVINRVETDYQWYALDGSWQYEPITRRSQIATGTVQVGADAPARIDHPVDWGRYEVVVTADGGGASSIGFDAGWYTASGAMQTPDRMGVSLDRPAYRAGDTAQARIEAPADGIALVSVLSNRVVDLKMVPVKAGANTVDLPVTEAWGAGVYVTASAIRPVATSASRAPVRALGLAYAPVDPGDRKLAAVLDMPAEADPRGTLPVTLRVSGAQGQTHATIAAVDLGILNLTRFTAPDPQGHYFGQRRLGVALRDLYGRLIDGQSGQMGALRAGGDAQNALNLQAPPPTEELMSFFSGPITLAADGTATVDVPLPAFNGTVRVMAVVWSDQGVGQASGDVLVRDPVVVTASAPRFLAPGDQARVLLELTHASGPSGQMQLAATGQGIALGDLPASVDLADKGSARLSLPITAPDHDGLAGIDVTLTTPDGKALTRHLAIPVQSMDPEVTRQSRLTLAAGQSLTLDADLLSGMVPGSGRALLSIGAMARLDSAAIMAGLASYPYGCTEQVTSQAIPLLAFETQGGDLPGTEQAGERIDQAIAKVLTRQDSNGAFGLWEPGSGDGWLDAYVTDFLSRAKSAGHAVPEPALRQALNNLKNQVNYAADFDASTPEAGSALAYQLMVLAREGAAAVGDLRYYADVKAGDFGNPLAVAQLGAALAHYGDQTRADALFRRAAGMLAPVGSDEPQLFRADYGTHLRDRAGVLALAIAAGSSVADDAGLGASLAASLSGQPLSPQEAMWSLLAAGAALDQPGTAGFTLNGQPLTGRLVRDVTPQGAAQPVVLSNATNRDEAVTLTLTGVPQAPEPAGGKGYTITRLYFTPDGQPIDATQVATGTRMVAVIEVTPHGGTGTGGRLMVDAPLPAGFEIDNPHLLASGDTADLAWLNTTDQVAFSQFRQDRFLTALDWTDGAPFRLAYGLRAITPGSFHHAAATVQDMYRPDWRAWTDSGRVVVAD
ncbi:MG2 domain-containing protein [Paracoccus sp. p3-h83]|uniref:alpha-2-macroglobulin family protein n=1 Tax=Paracoccus sp. p3-h83 TaxID=3342805 RepID=UPI0035BA697F